MTLYTAIIILSIASFTDATCNFPADLNGIWRHSFHGNINFSSSTQFSLSIGQYKNIHGTCKEQVNSDTYIVVTDGVMIEMQPNFRIRLHLAICLKMEKLKENLYKLNHLTRESSLIDYARVMILGGPDFAPPHVVCNDNTTVSHKEYYLLMKNEAKDIVKIDCPNALRGTLNFSLNSTRCYGRMGICGDKSKIQITESSCSELAAYSKYGIVTCIYNTSIAGANVLWTYNMDSTTNESSTFAFNCFIYEVNSTAFKGTQNPRFCDSTQTVLDVSSGQSTAAVWGASIDGTFSDCVETATSTTTDIATTSSSKINSSQSEEVTLTDDSSALATGDVSELSSTITAEESSTQTNSSLEELSTQPTISSSSAESSALTTSTKLGTTKSQSEDITDTFTDELKNVVISASVGGMMFLLFIVVLVIVLVYIRGARKKNRQRKSTKTAKKIQDNQKSFERRMGQSEIVFTDISLHGRNSQFMSSNRDNNGIVFTDISSHGRNPQFMSSNRENNSQRPAHTRRENARQENVSNVGNTHAQEEQLPRINAGKRYKKRRRLIIFDPRINHNINSQNSHYDFYHNSMNHYPYDNESRF